MRHAISYLLPVALSVVAGCHTGKGNIGELHSFMQTLDYKYINPPTQLMAPGTIVAYWAEKYNGSIINKVDVVCSAEEASIAATDVKESDTVSLSVAGQSAIQQYIQASIYSYLSADQEIKNKVNVSASLIDAKIRQVSLAKLRSSINSASLAIPCKELLVYMQDKGYKNIAVVTSVIVANVVYHFSSEKTAKLALETGPELSKFIKAKLGLSVEGSNDTTMQGRAALYWGIRTTPLSLFTEITK